jgi:hypothetical protein
VDNLRRIVLASERVHIPSEWADAEVIREHQLRGYTPTGSVRKAIEWMQTVPEMKVDGQSLLDIVRYDGTSLWWFIHTLVYSSAKQAILMIERSERLLQEKTPDQVAVAGLGVVGELVASVCQQKKVAFTLLDGRGPSRIRSLTDEAKVIAGRLLLGMKEFRRGREGRGAKKRVETQQPHVIFLSPSANWRSIWNYEKSLYERRDVFMGRVADEVQRMNFEVTCVDVDYSLGGHVGLLREKMRVEGVRWVPFEQYLTGDVGTKVRSDPNYRQLSRAFSLLDQSKSFKSSLEYDSVGLWGFMRGRFLRALSGLHALHYARVIEGARQMVHLEEPDAIVMSYETGAYARATIVAAWERGIPTLGIQHGFITPTSVEYMHAEAAHGKNGNGCPVPTKTTVGGQYSAELLTRSGGYLAESLAVTGYPKHDDLFELKRNESKLGKDRLLGELGLSSTSRAIMFASGGFHSQYGWIPEYDREILSSLLGFCSSRTDVQLIVRLHPMEDGAMEKRMVEGREGRTAIVKGERNDLLWASDLLVTANSVVALDALILGKPVFMLNMAEEEIPNIDLGDAVVRYNLQNLGLLLAKAMDDPQTGKALQSKVASEIERHANTLDGQASQRVACIIGKMARGPS